MTASSPKVLLVCNQRVRDVDLLPSDLQRLSTFATWEWLHLEGGQTFHPNKDPVAIGQLIERAVDVDCIVVCHGSPMITADGMDRAPNLKLVGELEGDRFAYRIDVEAAWKRGIRTVDTTHDSSETHLVLFLCGDKSAYINGLAIPIDGGFLNSGFMPEPEE